MTVRANRGMKCALLAYGDLTFRLFIIRGYMDEKRLRQLGHRIRLARKAKSITQEKLAELANLSTTYIGRLERGEKTPSIDTLVILSSALEVSPLDLLIDLDSSLGKEHIKNRISDLLGLL